MHVAMANRDKISQFRAATKTDLVTAQSILADNGWDVERATNTYRFMEQAAIPPPGPLKNVEPKLVPSAPPTSLTAASGVTASSSVTAASNVGRPLGGATNVNGLQVAAAPAAAVPNTLTYKLKRGLSKTSENFPLVNKARDVVLQDISEGSTERTPHFVETPEYTFMLPNLSQYPDDFRAFLHKDLIETSTLVALEQAGRLNWWADLGACQRLLPLATTGDGNCLLHAASLGMWGFHDRLLTLRRALYSTLNVDLAKGEFWRRWRWHQSQVNKQSGLIYSEVEWEKEWANLLKLASLIPRGLPQNNGGDNTASTNRQPDLSCDKGGATGGGEENEVSYESLEEFHVFVLAYVLRRPIIIVADTILKDSNGEALAPIPFGGIYLPFQCPPESCHRSPLLLTYDAAHFSALVAMEQVDNVLPAAIPVVDPEFTLLPIHFMLDPGPNYDWSKEEGNSRNSASSPDISLEGKLRLIGQYLDIEHVPLPSGLNNATAANSKPDSDSGSSHSSSVTGGGCAMLPPVPPGVVRTASVDSNDSVKSSQSVKERDGTGKEKERRKPAKQKVAITFGSLGRTMSKKLKNLGKSGTAAKQAVADKKEAAVSAGSTAPGACVSSLTADMLKDREHIACAKLLHKRLDYQQEMVNNYLASARERFKKFEKFDHFNQLRRERDTKMKRGDKVDGSTPVQCINQGCGRRGTAATSYLCDECFREQKQEALSLASLAKTGGSGSDSAKSTGLPRQDTMVSLPQSKFYTLSCEDHSLSRPKYAEEEKNTYNTELNNTQTVPLREKQMPLGDFSRSNFPVESHSMQDMNVPPGTAVIVNNLHGTSEKLYHTLPPKLRADFKADGCVHIPDKLHGRSAAFKLKNVDTKTAKQTQQLDEKYVARAQCGGPPGGRMKCHGKNCEFYGSEGTDFLCSMCYREKQKVLVYKAEKSKKKS